MLCVNFRSLPSKKLYSCWRICISCKHVVVFSKPARSERHATFSAQPQAKTVWLAPELHESACHATLTSALPAHSKAAHNWLSYATVIACICTQSNFLWSCFVMLLSVPTSLEKMNKPSVVTPSNSFKYIHEKPVVSDNKSAHRESSLSCTRWRAAGGYGMSCFQRWRVQHGSKVFIRKKIMMLPQVVTFNKKSSLAQSSTMMHTKWDVA